MTEYDDYIKRIIDKSIDFSNQYLRGLQLPDDLVPEYMIDYNKKSPYEGIVFWKSVPANITKEQFAEFENKIGFPLPETYKNFLSYKYYIELNFGHAAEFFPHTNTWKEDYNNVISDFGQDCLDRGLIPFARDTDQGYFCFDTKNVEFGNEYRILTCDRYFEEQVYPSIKGQFTFIGLIRELEQSLDDWKRRKENG
jgi:hypothetical protein